MICYIHCTKMGVSPHARPSHDTSNAVLSEMFWGIGHKQKASLHPPFCKMKIFISFSMKSSCCSLTKERENTYIIEENPTINYWKHKPMECEQTSLEFQCFPLNQRKQYWKKNMNDYYSEFFIACMVPLFQSLTSLGLKAAPTIQHDK